MDFWIWHITIRLEILFYFAYFRCDFDLNMVKINASPSVSDGKNEIKNKSEYVDSWTITSTWIKLETQYTLIRKINKNSILWEEKNNVKSNDHYHITSFFFLSSIIHNRSTFEIEYIH